ncbi:hypothetical protein ACH5RR_006414 [Cinchona calisaya]|uniref:Glutamate receptor n=1 Tax=Cinchona calisaya TaxID=153742 RepID=A0ABD3APA1_9GENT
MPNSKNLVFFVLFTILFLRFRVDSFHGTARISNVHIGAVLDLNSPMGAMIELCLSLALSDFYSIHSDYKTRLSIHTKSAEHELDVASAVLEMLKNEEVHGVLGPQWSKEATFVAELGARAQVPVISFTAKSRALSHSNSTYFVRTTPDDIYQVKSLAAICQGFDWQEVIVLYEDTEYGNIFFSKLYKAFQEINIHLSYISAISTSAEDVDLTKELNKTMEMYTKVFLLHMNIALGHRLFVLARNAGMMSEGYAWLMTDSLSNFLTSVDTSPMEGVLGLRPHVPQSKNLENFTAKWKRNAFFGKPAIMELNMYGLWAYDTVWALALAIERILPLNSDLPKSRQGELNISDISNLRVSQLGRRILTELLRTKFTGLSGEFHLVDGQLQPSAFEIFNLIGTGNRTVGYWTPDRGISKNVSSIGESTYSTSTKELRGIMWPGDTLVTPKAWGIPATRTLRVGVPHIKGGFPEFVNVKTDKSTNQSTASGFSIAIFEASLPLLPFRLHYKFVPYEDDNRTQNGRCDDMLVKMHDQEYDLVVGDVTILATRAKIVDFTVPYTESGIIMVVKNKRSRNMWIFLKPLSWDLWLTIVIACIIIGIVLRILEYEETTDTNTITWRQPREQPGLFCWFPIAILAFPERNMVANIWSRFLLVVWLFVAYILMQSYTAKLSAIFTVDQLHFGFSDDSYIGYQSGSFVKDYLINDLKFNESKLKDYTTIEEYHNAMTLGSEKGGIDVIYGELPYMKLLMHKYPSQYMIRGQPNKTYGDGFGFAFPRGSPLVIHFSRAILNVTQSTTMTMIEQHNFGYPSNQDSVINPDNPNLKAYNFGGLFIILGSSTIIALFFSKTSVGRNITSMVSKYGRKCSTFLFRAKDHESNPTNQAKGSPSEAVNESQNNTNISNTNLEAVPSPEPSTDQGEANESEPTNTDVISSGLVEIQLSESRNVETPAEPNK